MKSFCHPRANRQACLRDVVVSYEFRRGQRRTIGFSVGPQGLVVSAPSWVSLNEVDAALQEKSQWIVKKLDETRERHQRLLANQIEWQDGATIPFLGEPVRLLLTRQPGLAAAPAELRVGTPDSGESATAGAALNLHLGLEPGSTPAQIQLTVKTWLMRQALRNFTQRLDHFAPQLQVQWRRLALSNAKSRWGSARIDGSIRLNWRLLHFRQAVIDYVVVHELSHLRVMDHSPRFWDTVRTVLPDYAVLRKQLKDESTPRWA